MNFVTRLLDPFTSGFIYGTTIASTTDNIIKNVDDDRIINTIEIIASGWFYGYATEVFSKNLNDKAKYVVSGVLLSVAGYKLYKLLKKKDARGSDNVICEENKETITDMNSEITRCTKEDCIICECIENIVG
jgi:hypothetical protein